MQEAQRPRVRWQRTGVFRMVLAALVVSLLAFALVTALLIARQVGDDEGAGPGDAGASPGLSEQQALDEWRRLHELWLRSYRESDASLVSLYRAPDAPAPFGRVDKEIARLNRQHVLDKSSFRLLDLSVLASSEERVLIQETVVVTTRFVDGKTGEDLTVSGSAPERQTVEWELRPYAGEWKVYSSTIKSARKIRS